MFKSLYFVFYFLFFFNHFTDSIIILIEFEKHLTHLFIHPKINIPFTSCTFLFLNLFNYILSTLKFSLLIIYILIYILYYNSPLFQKVKI
jgi:hypothetical protein